MEQDPFAGETVCNLFVCVRTSFLHPHPFRFSSPSFGAPTQLRRRNFLGWHDAILVVDSVSECVYGYIYADDNFRTMPVATTRSSSVDLEILLTHDFILFEKRTKGNEAAFIEIFTTYNII